MNSIDREHLDCDLFRERIDDLLIGQLPEYQRRQSLAHQSRCQECREEFRSAQSIYQDLDAAWNSIETPRIRVDANPIARPAVHDASLQNRSIWPVVAIVAAAACFMIFLAWQATGVEVFQQYGLRQGGLQQANKSESSAEDFKGYDRHQAQQTGPANAESLAAESNHSGAGNLAESVDQLPAVRFLSVGSDGDAILVSRPMSGKNFTIVGALRPLDQAGELISD